MTFPHAMLRGLKANWNSYGAPPIDERCIQKAYELWRQLSGEWQVVPCNDGGVQLEQHRGGFDIEITVNRAGLETCECQCATYCMQAAGMRSDPPMRCRGLTGEDPGAHLRLPLNRGDKQ